ncbi:hypothetical protein AAKU61_002570 [Undibacterium sp. GrIS 1.2]
MTVLQAHIKSAKHEDYTPKQYALRRALQHRTTKPPRTRGNPHESSFLRGGYER